MSEAQALHVCRLCGREITAAPVFRVTIEELARTPGSAPASAFHPVKRRPAMLVHGECAAILEERVGILSAELTRREQAARAGG